ncbi:hypothetical protein ABZ208_33925 [Streptomyces sp. NPDC006208]|uniref:hypothetical protein n=1 Tax=Streptomyces sp. NPDC006208 TaxID=3156734 RepID=UPI0033A30364
MAHDDVISPPPTGQSTPHMHRARSGKTSAKAVISWITHGILAERSPNSSDLTWVAENTACHRRPNKVGERPPFHAVS